MIGASMAVRAPRTRGLAGMAMDAIRRNNGTLLLPGAATPNGDGTFSYGNPPLRNYLDSAGTDLLDSVTQVDQPVGLVLDSMGVLGAELPIIYGWTNIGGGRYQKSANTWAGAGAASIPSCTGKTFAVYFEVESIAAGSSISTYRRNAADTDNEVVTTISVVAGGSYTSYVPVVRDNAGTNFDVWIDSYTFGGVIKNLSVREIPGNHATQATTASKPILRRTSGRYSWQFDGSNDSLALGSVPFQMSDDHCVVVGANTASAVGDTPVFRCFGASNTPIVGSVGYTVGKPDAVWRDNAGTLSRVTGATAITGSNNVLSIRKNGNAKQLRLNGVQVGVDNTAVGATTLTGAAIGQNGLGGGYMNGSTSAVVIMKATVSDADLALIERFVGSLQGQQL